MHHERLVAYADLYNDIYYGENVRHFDMGFCEYIHISSLTDERVKLKERSMRDQSLVRNQALSPGKFIFSHINFKFYKVNKCRFVI